MHFYLIILFIFNVRRDIRAELSTLTSAIRWRVTQYSCIKQRASVCDTQWTNQLFKIISVLVGLFYMILVTLNKHTDHMTSIKCHLLKWSAWKTLVPGGLLSTGHSESCVTGKMIAVHYYHQCPFIKGQQVMAPMTVWRDFLSGSLQIVGFYFSVCNIMTKGGSLDPCTQVCTVLKYTCTNPVMVKGWTDKLSKYK